MSQPDSGRPANESGPWPYGPPDQVPGYPDDSTAPDQELHHTGAVHGDPDPWDIPQDPAVPPDWPGYGVYTPGPEDQSPSDNPPEPAPYVPPPDSGWRRRSPVRPVMIAALLLAIFAAGSGAALLPSGTIHLSPATNPRATATSGLGAKTAMGDAGNGGSPAVAQPPAITKAEAERVVSRYWQVNNQANESYSDSRLATIESGSSYAMDAGSYRFALGSTDRTPYAAFELTGTQYYIPRLPRTAYPRWFVVRGTYVTLSAGKSLGSAYIVFAQDSPGAAWKDVTEPDILPGRALPQIATGNGGYAESVAADAGGLSVAPDKIGQVTAAWLDQVAADPSNTAVLADAGNLTDLKDDVFWRSGEGGATFDAADTHSVPADDRVFALKTTDGGALLFYTVAAHLVLTPPDGDTISALNIPGYYSPSSSAGLTSAAVGYIEQFATYVPAADHSGRRIVADISSIASRG